MSDRDSLKTKLSDAFLRLKEIEENLDKYKDQYLAPVQRQKLNEVLESGISLYTIISFMSSTLGDIDERWFEDDFIEVHLRDHLLEETLGDALDRLLPAAATENVWEHLDGSGISDIDESKAIIVSCANSLQQNFAATFGIDESLDEIKEFWYLIEDKLRLPYETIFNDDGSYILGGRLIKPDSNLEDNGDTLVLNNQNPGLRPWIENVAQKRGWHAGQPISALPDSLRKAHEENSPDFLIPYERQKWDEWGSLYNKHYRELNTEARGAENHEYFYGGYLIPAEELKAREWERNFFENRFQRAEFALDIARHLLTLAAEKDHQLAYELGIAHIRKPLGEDEREFLFEKKHWNILLAKVTPSLRLMIKEHIEFSDTVLVFGPDDEDSDVSRTLSLNLSMSEQSNNMLSASDLSDIQESIGKCLIETLVELRAFPQGATHKGMPLYQDASNSSDDEPVSSEEIGYVYFVRNQDLYKIGITKDLKRRMDELKPDEIINTVRCKNSREVEKDLHDTFKDYRLPQTEYFRLDSAQIGLVNKLMMRLADF